MTKEEFIKNIVDNLTIRKEERFDRTFYYHNGYTAFEMNYKYNVLLVSRFYVWRIFTDEFQMKYADIEEFIKHAVVKPLNLGNATPQPTDLYSSCFAYNF